MARTVSYAEQTLESPNPFTRFAHRSRYKVSLDLSDRLLPLGGHFVDFGCGPATLQQMFAKTRADARLTAIEPYVTELPAGIARVDDMADLADASVDLLGAFEVLEHLTDPLLDSFLGGARRVLAPGGKLLVTVPIMYGLTLPVKEVSRILLHRKLGDTGPLEMAKATLGLPIARTPNPLASHKGFDFRALERKIGQLFRIERELRSPFPALPWWLNSQAIFIAG